MKTIEELKIRARELSKQTVALSHQAGQVLPQDRKEGLNLMRQAREMSKRCQVVVGEIIRREKLEG
jgi:predicted TIM-barrel fold metal-dependent hydrolase